MAIQPPEQAPSSRARLHSVAASVILAAVAIVGSPVSSDAQAPCNAEAQSTAIAASSGYSLRNTRCEGTYRPMVGVREMQLISFVERFDDFDPSAGPLKLSWASPADELVYVEVLSTKPGEAYRMDTRVEGGNGYEWSTEVLNALSIERRDLHPVAFQFGEAALYLPLRIQQDNDSTDASGYVLTVAPNTPIQDVKLTVAPVAAVGERASGDFIVFDESVDARRAIARGDPIPITITGLGEAGIYVAEVTGIERGGTAMPTKAFWFYHPGS